MPVPTFLAPAPLPPHRTSIPIHLNLIGPICAARKDPVPRPRAQKPRSQPPTPASSSNRSLANLHELTERIADLLHVGTLQESPLHCPKDAPLGYLSATTHVAVVFGKHLIRDQVTVEYAKRVVTLVKQIASGALDPDVICFAGGKGRNDEGSVSEAVIGYTFFRNLCEEAQVDVTRFEYILEEKSHNTKENLANVIKELRRRNGSAAVAACHFTLVSSDYHLIRIQEVHRLSPRQSILFPLQVSRATWNCIFAAYPFCVSRDPATAFLGRAVVLANDLGIVLVNLNGALADRQFLSKENLHRLDETFAKMREMYRIIDSRAAASGGFRTDMRTHAETLEMAIHGVREVQTLLSPLREFGTSVPHAQLELASDLLTSSIFNMRASMDPDRVLRVHDRLAIVDDMASFMYKQRVQPRGSGGAEGSSSDEDTDGGDSFEADGWLDGPLRAPGRPRIDMSTSEVTWQGSAIFKGNGKRITRDGPNLVITDSGPPPLVNAQVKRTRARRRTAAQSDSLAGRLGGALVSDQVHVTAARPGRPRTTVNTPRTRSATSAPAKGRKAGAVAAKKSKGRKIVRQGAESA